MNKLFLLPSIIFVTLLVTACGPTATPEVLKRTPTSVSPTATSVPPSSTPTSTPIPTPTNTPTTTPTHIPTPAPTNTATPTPTLVPSLSGRVTDAAIGQGIVGPAPELSFELRMTKVFWANQKTPKEVEFTAKLRGDNVTDVTLLSPTNKRILAITFYEREGLVYYKPYELLNSFSHEYYKIGEPDVMNRRFPLGDYTFRILYYVSEGEKEETLVHSFVGDFPPRPVITYPDHDQTEVELEPLIEWGRTPDDPRFRHYFVHIGIPREGTPHWELVLDARIEDIDQPYYQVPPGIFQPNTTCHVWVGVEYDGVLESKSGIQFTTVVSP